MLITPTIFNISQWNLVYAFNLPFQTMCRSDIFDCVLICIEFRQIQRIIRFVKLTHHGYGVMYFANRRTCGCQIINESVTTTDHPYIGVLEMILISPFLPRWYKIHIRFEKNPGWICSELEKSVLFLSTHELMDREYIRAGEIYQILYISLNSHCWHHNAGSILLRVGFESQDMSWSSNMWMRLLFVFSTEFNAPGNCYLFFFFSHTNSLSCHKWRIKLGFRIYLKFNKAWQNIQSEIDERILSSVENYPELRDFIHRIEKIEVHNIRLFS